MNRSLLAVILMSTAAAATAIATLKQGQIAPDFTTQASLAGREFTFSLYEALKSGPVVVYFYPAAFSGGCNLQAHTFAEDHDKFAAAGATVVGVSLDSIGRLNEFSSDPLYCAGKLPVASDEQGTIAKSFGVNIAEAIDGNLVAKMKDARGVEFGHGAADRTTFIVGSDGRIVATVGGVGGADNAKQSLAIVQKLASIHDGRR